MSTWTHVVGCIRIDGIPAIGHKKQTVIDALGPMCTFEEWRDDSTLPQGSEGGLQYQVIQYSNGLPWLAIPVWGDLRDFDSIEEIRSWWTTLLPKLGVVRDAVLLVQIEGQDDVILTHERTPCQK
jgi:hypothetical protein